MLIPLRRYILYRYDTLGAFCAQMGITQSTLSRWLRGQTPMRLEEIATMSKMLNISPRTIVMAIKLGMKTDHKKRLEKLKSRVAQKGVEPNGN